MFPGIILAQTQLTDSMKTNQMEEVVVTATRNERTLGTLPMPVTLVSKGQIKIMGSLRLNDVLAEQTGLVVVPQVNGQGNGIQLQGFNPDYTLILIDGEPLIGRYTGSLELSRITVGNIKQIEIVKGPSSSLYGSDALAGVINIITDKPKGVKANFSTRYGTFNTLDLTGDVSATGKKLGVYFFVNRFSTDGYDLSPENFGKTVSPFKNLTINSKVTYQLGAHTDLSISGRWFEEQQRLAYEVATVTHSRIRTSGNGNIQDWNINPVVTHRFSSKLKAVARLYFTQYQTNTNLSLDVDKSSYYHDDFKQSFLRPEVNAEYAFNEQNITTLGAGNIRETVQTSRYGDEAQRHQETTYGFFQHEWQALQKLTVIGGGRYDYNSIYGSQFSPKLSSRFEVNKMLSLKGSFGVGFKAPDFRQLYFNFTNSAAGGYSVLGTEIVRDRLAALSAQGEIGTYLYDPSLIGELKAERSVAINMGIRIVPFPMFIADFNAFHNSIDNLIESQAVAITTAGQNIYSYRNIRRAYTQGIESNFSCPIFKNISASIGYQLLFARDKDVEASVKRGDVYWRDPNTLVTRRLRPGEYFGLYNRSRHMGNFKIFYDYKEKGWSASLRVIYRGKYGVGDIQGNIQGESPPSADRDNNAILDQHDSFIKGYALVNVSVVKTIRESLRLQAGVDNLFDHREPLYIPNLPGRQLYVSMSYSISKKNNDK